MNFLQKTVMLLQKRSVLYLITVLVLDVLFFSTTDPSKVAAPWLIVGYILAVMTLYWLIRAFIAFVGLYIRAVRIQKRRLTKVLTIVGAVTLAMQSVGQLSFRDLAVLMPLALIAYFYFSYGRGKRKA
jgi:hypothetical protein